MRYDSFSATRPGGVPPSPAPRTDCSSLAACSHFFNPSVKYQAYNRDDFPDKVNVGVGAYRCDQGAPFVLPVVREAEKAIIAEGMDHEYSGIVSVRFSIVMRFSLVQFSSSLMRFFSRFHITLA
jgi:hypothetical protein